MTDLSNAPDLLAEEQDAALTAIFATPTEIEGVWLVEALLGVLRRVPWAGGLLGGDLSPERLEHVLRRRRADVPEHQNNVSRRELTGEYEATGLMLGLPGSHAVQGMQVFRALLWLALAKDHREGRRSAQHVSHLGDGLRAARPGSRSRSSTLNDLLNDLANVASFEQGLELLSFLAIAKEETLRKAWTDWLGPQLGALLKQSVPVDPKDKGAPRKRSQGVDRAGVGSRQRSAKRRTTQVERLRRTRPYDRQLPHEPPEEFTSPSVLVTADGLPSGTSQAVKRFYAQRAIWSGNRYLLTHHIDALDARVYGGLMRHLADSLDNAAPATESAIGTVGALLKGLTGRTTQGLVSIHPGPVADAPSVDTACLDLDAGILWLPVFWKLEVERPTPAGPRMERVSYFRPSASQKPMLAPVAERIALPLPTPLRKALQGHRETIGALATVGVPKLDEAMAGVLKGAATSLDLAVSVAGLRRALGPLLYERYGDLALAQLICGESFGLTTAPLHYYAPTLRRVAEAYRDLLADHFGESGIPRIPGLGTRVGSELFATRETTKLLAATSLSHAPAAGSDQLGVPNETVTEHRRIVDHLARMIVATSGHRPTAALFEITLADVDLVSGAALFRDKRHDIAHDPRLAALPEVATAQIEAYCRHLHGLQSRRPELAKKVAAIFRGEDALLFDLAADGTCQPLSPERLAGRGPVEWTVLPWNWSRTRIRTAAIEAGAPAFLVAAQLGHFDSIGYPYSNQSPTDPMDVVEATRPWLDTLAKRAGWSVLESRLGTGTPCAAQSTLGPLEIWSERVAQADALAATAHRAWERRIKTERHRLREDAMAAALAAPALEDAGLSQAYRESEIAVSPAALMALDVEAIRSALVLDAGDDAIVAVARIRALGQVLRTLFTRARLSAPVLAVPIAVRRPLDNAFFRGACRALSQVNALRTHVRDRGRGAAPKRCFDVQVARTAEALALFGGMEDPEVIRAVLSARARAMPSARLVDVLLVPLEDGRVVAVRGVAALALAAFAHDYPTQEVPSLAALDAGLAALMPDWALPRGSIRLLAALCSTVRVSNRFELSPAARFSLDEVSGSVPASLEEQLALVDGDAVVTRRVEPSSATDDAGEERACSDRDAAPAAETPRRHYLQLVGMIPKVGKALSLPLTGVSIPATAINTRPTRGAVIGELEAWLGPPDRPVYRAPIVRMLAEWALAELQRPRPGGRRLADSSVATYVTRIGAHLVEMLGDSDPAHWDETSIEDAYEYALQASDRAKFKVAAALLSFHRFSEARYDLPDVDLGLVYAMLGTRKRRVDCELILPADRERALAELERQAWQAGSEHTARTARIAHVTAVWLARAGARLREPLGFRVRDLGKIPDGPVYARITSNRMRSLKTMAGRRTVVLAAAAASEPQRVWAWRDAVASNAKPSRAGSAYLTAGLESRRSFDEHAGAAHLIRQALAQQTGRPSERLHRLRHLVAHEGIAATVLSDEDAARLAIESSTGGRMPEPRDLAAVSVPLGHAHWLTTLQAYFHVPWLLQSRAAARRQRLYFDRKTLPGALGYTAAFLDSLLRDRPDADKVDLWFARFRTRRLPPDRSSPADGQGPEASGAWRWSARSVGRLLEVASRCASLAEALALSGAPIEAEQAIRTQAASWEYKIGRRLLPLATADDTGPRRALRRETSDLPAERLWDLFDAKPAARAELLAIAQSAFVHADTRPGEQVRLRPKLADRLVGFLRDFEIEDQAIKRTPLRSGLVQLAVSSAAAKDDGANRPIGLRRVLAVLQLTAALQGLEEPR